MKILAVRTESPQAEVHLIENDKVIEDYLWQAHKTLSDSLLKQIENLLKKQSWSWSDVQGVIVYKGPGSFTGLRIGVTVAMGVANANNAPIVGTGGELWIHDGINRLQANESDDVVTIEYGGEANITKPRK